jgi:hypothetical protein
MLSAMDGLELLSDLDPPMLGIDDLELLGLDLVVWL